MFQQQYNGFAGWSCERWNAGVQARRALGAAIAGSAGVVQRRMAWAHYTLYGRLDEIAKILRWDDW